jgi:hypothetical protein
MGCLCWPFAALALVRKAYFGIPEGLCIHQGESPADLMDATAFRLTSFLSIAISITDFVWRRRGAPLSRMPT